MNVKAALVKIVDFAVSNFQKTTRDLVFFCDCYDLDQAQIINGCLEDGKQNNKICLLQNKHATTLFSPFNIKRTSETAKFE